MSTTASHNIAINTYEDTAIVSLTDAFKVDRELWFHSISEARAFAYELLNATMDYEINNNVADKRST